MEIEKRAIEILKEGYMCDNCLGRTCAGLLTGYTNRQRGKIIRQFLALSIDSGEKIEVDNSNFYGIRFRNIKIKPERPKECMVCKNFFIEKIDMIAEKIAKKLEEIEFETFLIGTVIPDSILKKEEEIWNKTGIEFTETIKSEINRELGKRVEKITKKKFEQKDPDVTVITDLNTGKIKTEIRSLYIFGKYKKLVRGIPQTKWVCHRCKGVGCSYCKGIGKLYLTSVQEIVEKPLLKAAKSKSSSFHGHGREDIDARCLDYRPFVIEIVKPIKRKIDLKKIEKEINKSKKVKVKGLKFTTKDTINKLKFAKIDKTYLATVDFEKTIEKKKLKELRNLTKEPILQKTPLRVLHRRADKFRKRSVKKISWKILAGKKLQLKITAETGLYIKELITGDEGRTKPSVAEVLGNKVKKISLDVIKIHTKR
ncbi:MAG: tRNA pseudouridine(54/55) synthase Pus10 [Candidatus Aenigmarchaeota archaeon]|nr:tRNA pseudouridine(54/55) synthase Pus10 [Candidatus Aenigmarchaeota archaeon]